MDKNRTRNHLSFDQTRELRTKYKSGASISDLCLEFDCSKSSVYRHCRSINQKIPTLLHEKHKISLSKKIFRIDKTVSMEEFLLENPSPQCFLTGQTLYYSKPSSYKLINYIDNEELEVKIILLDPSVMNLLKTQIVDNSLSSDQIGKIVGVMGKICEFYQSETGKTEKSCDIGEERVDIERDWVASSQIKTFKF